MLKEVQVNKTEQKVYLLDENYDVFGVLPMSTDYYQDNGNRSNADDGVYRDTVWYSIDFPDNGELSAAYGYSYINVDTRGRALHGGGSALGQEGALEPFQSKLMPTLGCFRLYNVDIWWLCQHWKRAVEAGENPCIHVVS